MAIPLPIDMKIGSIHKTREHGDLEIIKISSSTEVVVRFIDTGYETTTILGNIRKGAVKDKLHPYVLGVGFIGVGEFKGAINGRKTEAYNKWGQMLTRCYSDKYQSKNPAYKGCIVIDEWHNFQNFASWISSQGETNGFELDKDLLFCGNKVYSKETCLMVPRWLNSFTLNKQVSRGDYPVGVSMSKVAGKFTAYCNENGKRIHLGYYHDPEAAHSAWMEKKLSIALSKKNEMDAIDERIYPNVVSIIKGMKQEIQQ